MSDDEKIVQLPTKPKPGAKGALTVVRYSRCRHLHTLVDEQLAEVKCADCGEKLNPIWVLARLGDEDDRIRNLWARMRAEVRLAAARTRVKCRNCGGMTPVDSRASDHVLRELADKIKAEESP